MSHLSTLDAPLAIAEHEAFDFGTNRRNLIATGALFGAAVVSTQIARWLGGDETPPADSVTPGAIRATTGRERTLNASRTVDHD